VKHDRKDKVTRILLTVDISDNIFCRRLQYKWATNLYIATIIHNLFVGAETSKQDHSY
jgi:hypothetical protein